MGHGQADIQLPQAGVRRTVADRVPDNFPNLGFRKILVQLEPQLILTFLQAAYEQRAQQQAHVGDFEPSERAHHCQTQARLVGAGT